MVSTERVSTERDWSGVVDEEVGEVGDVVEGVEGVEGAEVGVLAAAAVELMCRYVRTPVLPQRLGHVSVKRPPAHTLRGSSARTPSPRDHHCVTGQK